MATDSRATRGATPVRAVEAPEPSARNEFPPVLTTALAAELLQIHVEYLRKMVREGKVPCHRFPEGREMRFLRDELLDWLRAQPGADRSPGADHPPVLGTKNHP